LIQLGGLLAEDNPNEKKVLVILAQIQFFHKEVACEKLSQYGINIEEFIDTFFIDLETSIRFYIHQKNKVISPGIENDYSITNTHGKIISLL
jgi:hypothetical protein